MGKPKFSRKKYVTPSHPWQQDRIKDENELIKKYGLKNKREIWKAETKLRTYRGQARELLAKVETSDQQSKKESQQLLNSLNKMNILAANSNLDDVLALDTESVLSRRLQTLTYLKGLSNTPNQARQLISHGHIAVGNRRVTVPGYMVSKEEEKQIGYTQDSSLNDAMHPARPRSDFKTSPIPKKQVQDKTEKKQEEKKEETQQKPDAEPEKPAEKDIKENTSEVKQEQKTENIEKITQKQEEEKKEDTEKQEEKPQEPIKEEKNVKEEKGDN